ncbi:MAG: hypothetical protein H6839_10940 [Planctomycetes bacterium]|nr:hypothetical protein [Planctomycetota bacterium]
MKRIWLICALATICAGCVAKSEPNGPPARQSSEQPSQPENQSEREPSVSADQKSEPHFPSGPLPLFHPDYKAGQPWHEYNENTEANLSRLAGLAQEVIAVKGRKRDSAHPDDNPWVTSKDPTLLAGVRRAFSGNLMETRSPGLSFVTMQYEFECADGTVVELEDVGHYYSVEFPGVTWHMILATPEMNQVLQPIDDKVWQRN